MSDRCDPEFAPLIGAFDRTMLAEHPGAVIGLRKGYRIGYLNAAWDRFAAANGGQPTIERAWDIGANYLEAVPGELMDFFRDLFTQAVEGGTLNPARHVYECSSAARYRQFQMSVYGLAAGGLLVVHSAVMDRPHTGLDAVEAPRHAEYADRAGVVRQCAHCRRFARPDAEDRWDWVPAWVDRAPPSTSFAICGVCFGHYFGAEVE